MELSNFIKLLKRQKYTLIFVPLLAIAITYFLVRKMPDSYTSKARIGTGLVDQSQQSVLGNQADAQESKINQQFANLIQMMQLKKVYDQVSYQLILHDLTNDTSLRKPSKLFKELPENAKKHAREIFTELYRTRSSLQPTIDDHVGLKKVLISMGYDDETLRKKMVVYRVNNSDYIDIEFESDSPLFSAFAINTLCKEFINYYTDVVKLSQLRAVNFLDSILQQKKAIMDRQMSLLKNYKIDNRVLNLNEQAKSLYGQLADFETRKEITEKDILAYKGALKNIDAKFNPQDRQFIESAMVKVNQEIITVKEQVKLANEEYIQSNYDSKYKQKLDSLRTILVTKINESTDKYIVNPLAAKQNLVFQKIGLEVNLDIATYSVQSLESELIKLNKKFDELVPHEAVIQAYETSIDFASKEYIEILKKYNETSLESSQTIQLRLVEIAMPGGLQPSKKSLLIILSGVISLILCMVVLFVLFYLDDSVKVAKELANKTEITVLGFLPMIKKTLLNLQEIWNEDLTASIEYRNLLRDIRFEIETGMQASKVLLINSINPKEGKTILVLSLAYAYSRVNKKVLLIDGNFVDPKITEIVQPVCFLEDYLENKITCSEFLTKEAIDVLGSRGGDVSLLEIANENNIEQKLSELKAHYDIIIIEASALNYLNKSKEWILFSDKILSVFQANQTITLVKQQHINYLKSLDNKFIGWVLNKVTNEKVKFKKTKKKK